MRSRDWNVVILESGVSLNQNWYRPDIVKAGLKKFDGAPVQMHPAYDARGNVVYVHLTEAEKTAYPMGFPKDLVGVLTQPRWNAGHLSGILHLFPHDQGVHEALTQGYQRGIMPFGLSVDIAGPGHWREAQGQPIRFMESIEVVNSVDCVSYPAGGGRILGPSGQMPVSVRAAQLRAQQAAAMRALEPRLQALEARAEAFCQRIRSR
jgi:hypothetical protein